MINTLRLQNFRSYADASFSFETGVNIVVGPNGSGKTNLLEAVLVAARGGSYRVSDAELITFEHDWTRLDATTYDEHTRTVKISLLPRQTKTYEFDEKRYTRLTLAHQVPVTLFEPNELQLLHGAPDIRRIYLDDLLEQIEPGFISFRRNYRRLLTQRNSLLKRAKAPSNDELFPWNLRLSELGATIARARAKLVTEVQQSLPGLYGELSRSGTDTALTYRPQFDLETYESTLLAHLEQNLERDRLRGFTAYGPHREDFEMSFNGRTASETASRGETRTAVLALKISELRLIERVRGQKPLLLLDDVFSELDATRRQALVSYLHGHQTFITTTDADVSLLDTGSSQHVIDLGSVT